MAASSAAKTVNMKFYKKTKCFSCAWDTMALALWQRYPNPHSKHVLSEDAIARLVSRDIWEGQRFRLGSKTIFRTFIKMVAGSGLRKRLSKGVHPVTVKDGVLCSSRLFTKRNTLRIPRWAERVVGGASSVFVLEESVVDPGRQMFVTYTRNISLTKLSCVEEKCEFFVHPNDPQKTCVTKMAWFKSSIAGLSQPIEHFVKERYQGNAEKAELGLQYVIDHLVVPNAPHDS